MSLPVWLKSMFQPRRRPLRRNPPLSSLRLRWRCRLFLEPLEDRFVPATIGNEIFLQGDFIEVGIHSAGSFGTNANAPAGFHPTNGGLGFVVDPGKDGWTVGTPPKSGDFFMPGTPEEGWTVEWNSANGTERNFSNYGRVSGTAVTPTRVQETSSGDTRSAVWEGTATSGSDSLKITQTVHFKKSDQFFVISVTLTNTGTTTLNNVQYMRNVDPDQEQPLTGNFTTDNYVVYQPPHPGVTAGTSGNTNKALVVGRGLNFGIPLGLGAIDPRATVSTEGFSNRDPDAIINSPVAPSINSPIRADQAIVIAFDLGTLAPGQSVTFDYVYILNQADLENALGQLAAVTILQPTGTVSGNSVVFQATTDDVSHTSKIEFFAGNTKVGEDATEDAGGVYSTSFSSLAYSNGALELKAIATFDDGRIVEKTATVTVTNDGPPIALSTPSSGQFFSGSNIPIAVQILDANHAPTQVSFFRESGGTSTTLAVDTSAPFSTTFSVDDLDPGANVVIKAVARDSLGRTTTVQVAGSVASNLPPVANPQNVATQEDQSVTIQLTGDDGDDGENQTLTYQITQQPQNGTIQDFDPATGSLTYNPGQNFTGEDAIGFTVSDNGTPGPLTSPEATVTITVNPVNDGPQAENASFVLAENSPTGKVLGLVSATDVDSETLNYAIIAGNTGEAFEIDGSSGQITVANGAALDFEANPHFSLTVEVSDGESSEQAVVTVDLTNVNEGPQFQGNPLQVTTGENRSQLVQLQTPQVDSPNEEGEEVSVESFQITQLPEHGKLLAGETELQVGDLVTDDSIIYVPDPNYSGQDSFNYGAVDSDGNSTTASQEVAIAIGAGVHLLINQGEPLQGLEGQPIRVPFQTDEAGPGLDAVVRVTVSGLPSNARFVRVDANGNVVNETDPSLGTRNEEGDWVFDDGLASGLYVVVPNVVGTQEFHLQVTTESALSEPPAPEEGGEAAAVVSGGDPVLAVTVSDVVLTVSNVAPTVEPAEIPTVSSADPTIQVAAIVKDSGADVHNVVIDYGDGTTPVEVSLDEDGNLTEVLEHTYNLQGQTEKDYRITITATDDTTSTPISIVVHVVSPQQAEQVVPGSEKTEYVGADGTALANTNGTAGEPQMEALLSDAPEGTALYVAAYKEVPTDAPIVVGAGETVASFDIRLKLPDAMASLGQSASLTVQFTVPTPSDANAEIIIGILAKDAFGHSQQVQINAPINRRDNGDGTTTLTVTLNNTDTTPTLDQLIGTVFTVSVAAPAPAGNSGGGAPPNNVTLAPNLPGSNPTQPVVGTPPAVITPNVPVVSLPGSTPGNSPSTPGLGLNATPPTTTVATTFSSGNQVSLVLRVSSGTEVSSSRTETSAATGSQGVGGGEEATAAATAGEPHEIDLDWLFRMLGMAAAPVEQDNAPADVAAKNATEAWFDFAAREKALEPYYSHDPEEEFQDSMPKAALTSLAQGAMVVDGAGYYQTVAANEPDAVPATVVLIGLGVGALMPPADNKNSRRRQPTVR